MEVIIDKDTARLYVKREPTPEGKEPQHTHQFRKFGVTMVWDGSGNLLGIEFAPETDVFDDMPEVRYISSAEIHERMSTSAAP